MTYEQQAVHIAELERELAELKVEIESMREMTDEWCVPTGEGLSTPASKPEGGE